MSVTLQNLIDETADYVKVDLSDDEDSAAIESRITSALNEAKNIVAKKIRLTTSEDISLDENSCFDTDTDLTYTFWKLVTVKYEDSYVYFQEQDGDIWCDAPAFGTVAVEYEYIPADLTLAADTYPLPAAVSWRVLCYYAAARYYEIKGTSSSLNKANMWRGRFNDELEALRGGSKKARRKVKATYNYGDYYGNV